MAQRALLSRPGEAVYNSDNGRIDKNNLFQVAWLPDDERRKYLNSLNDLSQQREFMRSRPLVVFEGNTPVRIIENPVFTSDQPIKGNSNTLQSSSLVHLL